MQDIERQLFLKHALIPFTSGAKESPKYRKKFPEFKKTMFKKFSKNCLNVILKKYKQKTAKF